MAAPSKPSKTVKQQLAEKLLAQKKTPQHLKDKYEIGIEKFKSRIFQSN